MQYVLALLMGFLQQPDSLQLRQQILGLHIQELAIDNIHDVGNDYCLVALTLKPNIKVQVWLPKKGWNGRFLGTGNGGSGGKIITDKLTYGVLRIFACISQVKLRFGQTLFKFHFRYNCSAKDQYSTNQ